MLLQRSRKLARAGWQDVLTNRAEDPPQLPWGRWGDNRTARIIANTGLGLGSDAPGGWFQPMPNGGWGYAYQPLTDAWEIEFTRTMPSYGSNHQAAVYIDQDWTAGQQGEAIGGKNRYQVYIYLNRYQTRKTTKDPDTGETTTETKDYYNVGLVFRDTQDTSIDWFNNQPDTGAASTTDVGATVWNAPMKIRLVVYGDSLYLLYVNDVLRIGMRYNNTNYNLEAGHRAANFAHLNGVEFRVRNFSTRDIEPMPNWSTQFFDDFNRANNSSIGNGWTKRGSNGAINNNAYSMQGGGGDGLGSIARNITSFNQQIEVVFGGGTGDPTDIVPGFVSMRMNAAGTQGLYFRLQKGNLDLYQWTSGTLSGAEPTSTRVQALSAGYLGVTLVNGDRMRFTMFEDLLLVERNGQLVHARTGLLSTAITSRSNTWAGLAVNHGAFIVNSVPFNSFEAKV